MEGKVKKEPRKTLRSLPIGSRPIDSEIDVPILEQTRQGGERAIETSQTTVLLRALHRQYSGLGLWVMLPFLCGPKLLYQANLEVLGGKNLLMSELGPGYLK